jgi:hypothetical protein
MWLGLNEAPAELTSAQASKIQGKTVRFSSMKDARDQ